MKANDFKQPKRFKPIRFLKSDRFVVQTKASPFKQILTSSYHGRRLELP